MQDILITPQPSSGEPSILFTASGDVSPITLNVVSGISPVSGVVAAGSGITSLSFEGTQGQLFSITDNLSSGTLFSVSDIAGLPFMEIDASGDVKLAQFGNTITSYKAIKFANTANPSYSEGSLFYDNDNKCLAYYNDESDVTMQIGQEQFLRVRNNTGSTIANGDLVIINGSHGQAAPTITKAQADNEANAQVVGMATHSIEDSTFGYVTTYGIVRGLDTSSFSDGDEVFLSASTAGGLVSTPPVVPNYKVSVGHVISSHASNGTVLIQVSSPKLGGGDTKSEYPVYVSGIPFVTASGNGGSAAVLGYDSGFVWDSGRQQLAIRTSGYQDTLNSALYVRSDQTSSPDVMRIDTADGYNMLRVVHGNTNNLGYLNWNYPGGFFSLYNGFQVRRAHLTDTRALYITDSSASSHWKVSADGRQVMGGTSTLYSAIPRAQLDIINNSASQQGVVIQGAASQSANLTEWQTSAGDVLTSIDSDGNVDISGTLRCDDIGITTGHLNINAGGGSSFYFRFNNTVEYVMNAASFRPNNSAKDLGTDTARWTNLYTNNIYASGTITNPKGMDDAEAFGLLAVAANSGTAFGYDAVATGDKSVAIGHNSTANAAQSVAIGINSYTTGSNGIAIGPGAQSFGASTAIGYYADGVSQSVAIGHRAAANNTAGIYHTFIGYDAGYNGVNKYTTGLGFASLMASSGDYSVAIGGRALQESSGNFNIGIGPSAGQYVVGTGNMSFCTKGDKNTIGTNDAKLNINDMIKGDFNAGTLGINTDYNPGATLHAIAANATDVVGLFEGVAGQSANMLEVKDSAGNTDFSVGANGVTNVRNLDVDNVITLQSNYYVEWGGGNNRIRGVSGGVGAGRIEFIVGANEGTGGKGMAMVARGDGRGGKGAVIMGQNRDTDYHLEVVGSGSFEGVNISGALTMPTREDVGAGDHNFNIKYDPDFKIGGSQAAAMIISTDMDASGNAEPIHIIAGPSGTVNYNGIKILRDQVSLFGDLVPQ